MVGSCACLNDFSTRCKRYKAPRGGYRGIYNEMRADMHTVIPPPDTTSKVISGNGE